MRKAMALEVNVFRKNMFYSEDIDDFLNIPCIIKYQPCPVCVTYRFLIKLLLFLHGKAFIENQQNSELFTTGNNGIRIGNVSSWSMYGMSSMMTNKKIFYSTTIPCLRCMRLAVAVGRKVFKSSKTFLVQR